MCVPQLPTRAPQVLFGEPPTAEYTDALAYYTRAYELNPRKKAAVAVAETHAKLKQREEAREWARRALEQPGSGSAVIDEEMDRKARQLAG